MITEDYISFEIAKLLKEKGFDENTNCQYPVGGIHIGEVGEYNITDRSRNPENYIPAPTLQMVMKWLREIHHIHIAIYPYGEYSCNNYQFDAYKDNNFVVSKDDGYITYEQACEAAIKYCLTELFN